MGNHLLQKKKKKKKKQKQKKTNGESPITKEKN